MTSPSQYAHISPWYKFEGFKATMASCRAFQKSTFKEYHNKHLIGNTNSKKNILDKMDFR